jgi:threonine dehydrogenase-like Zn-dependent dehydrogenase
MNREINLIGSMRYGDVFDEAIRLVASGRVNLRPLINGVFTIDESVKAFAFAADKSQSFKVQIQL